MTKIRNIKAPASAPGELAPGTHNPPLPQYEWNTPDDVVDIQDSELANYLLRLQDAGFVEVFEEAQKPKTKEVADKPKEFSESPDDPAGDDAPKKTKRSFAE